MEAERPDKRYWPLGRWNVDRPTQTSRTSSASITCASITSSDAPALSNFIRIFSPGTTGFLVAFPGQSATLYTMIVGSSFFTSPGLCSRSFARSMTMKLLSRPMTALASLLIWRLTRKMVGSKFHLKNVVQRRQASVSLGVWVCLMLTSRA